MSLGDGGRSSPDGAAVDGPDALDGGGEASEPPEALRARLEVLAEENRRLRREYARARRSQYRRAAAGLAGVGAVAIAGAAAFPTARTVLTVLAAIGAFGGVLTYYLTPERFVAASVGERVYEALAATGDGLVGQLGLQDDRIYVPTAGAGVRTAALFVPQQADFVLPDAAALDELFVVPGAERARGVSLRPTGGPLLREFEAALAGELAADPGPLADQLADGVVEQFELADAATPELDVEGNRLTVAVTDSAMGAVDRFDHPVASFLAVGLARGLDEPVTLEVTPAGDDRADYLVTCRWGLDAEADG